MEYSQAITQAQTEVREQMELESATNEEKIIGSFLIEQFQDGEMKLAIPFLDGKCRLKDIWQKVFGIARKYLKSKSGGVLDETVFSWAVGIVQGKTDEEILAESGKPKSALRKPAKITKPAVKKQGENPEKKEGGMVQLSLFDL